MRKRKNSIYTYTSLPRILLVIFIGLALAGCTVWSKMVSPLPKEEVVPVKTVEAVPVKTVVKVKKPPKDKAPPYAVMTLPNDGDTSAPVSTNIVILVQDTVSGVNLSTVVMTVDGNEVYNGANPSQPGQPCQTGQYADTRVSGDPSNYTLTCDPCADFGYQQQVNVTIQASDVAGNVMPPDSYSFMTESQSGTPWTCAVDDDDCDGIPNDMESGLLETDPNIKTLFVRPKKETGFLQYAYWDEFIQLFQMPNRPGFADVPPFTNAGIEISVIGDPGNPYNPMQDFNYDPAQDPNHPPCDILEIVYKGETSYCAYGHHNYGHTYFSSIGITWYWDTKGYVPHNEGTYWQQHHYFTPQIYPFPLDNYVNEGAYNSIEVGQTPKVPAVGIPCPFSPYKQCYLFDYSSPLNWNKDDPVYGLPDDWVEFNQITFDSGTQAITYVGAMGTKYDRDTVLRRTIAHEMGHGILAASESDHCSDPQCIMYGFVKDWETRNFGPGNCVHSPGGAKDIRANGVIHNSIHY